MLPTSTAGLYLAIGLGGTGSVRWSSWIRASGLDIGSLLECGQQKRFLRLLSARSRRGQAAPVNNTSPRLPISGCPLRRLEQSGKIVVRLTPPTSVGRIAPTLVGGATVTEIGDSDGKE